MAFCLICHPIAPSLKTIFYVEITVLDQDGDAHEAVTCLGQWPGSVSLQKKPWTAYKAAEQ